MSISDRIFQVLKEKGMTQKEFSEKTSIPTSTISDWRKKCTNPSSDKIMVICKVLDIDLTWLLSGVSGIGDRANTLDWYAIDKCSELGYIIEKYNNMNQRQRDKLLGYIEGITNEPQ